MVDQQETLDATTWIIVLNWRGAADTIACIQSLTGLTGANWRLAVCDNASGDGSAEQIAEAMAGLFPGRLRQIQEQEIAAETIASEQAYLIRNGGNYGYAGGNNVGIRLALRDPAMRFCWVLNNDTVVDPGALRALLATAMAQPRAGIIGSTLAYHHAPDRMQAAGGATYSRWTGLCRHNGSNAPVAQASAWQQARMDYVVGASMFIRRTYLEACGLMDESFFLYFEEVDYCRRGRRRFSLAYSPESLVLHKEGGTTGGRPGAINLLTEFYMLRNRLRITRRHFPYALPLVLAGLLATALNRLRRGQPERLKLIWQIARRYQRIEFRDIAP